MATEARGGMHLCAYILRPESTGSVLIRSADPREMPSIAPNYGGLETDRRKMVDLVRYARRFMSQAPISDLVSEETRPGLECDSDEAILAAYDQLGTGAYHAGGTCQMGKEEDSVVDPRLRVRGVEELRVIDTSIFPFIPAGNTNAPTMATAWRAADLILDDR